MVLCLNMHGVVVEHRTLNLEILGSTPTDGTVLCPLARHINSSEFWLIPRTWWFHPDMTEKLLTTPIFLIFAPKHRLWGLVQGGSNVYPQSMF